MYDTSATDGPFRRGRDDTLWGVLWFSELLLTRSSDRSLGICAPERMRYSGLSDAKHASTTCEFLTATSAEMKS
jgi:hypothetical protein